MRAAAAPDVVANNWSRRWPGQIPERLTIAAELPTERFDDRMLALYPNRINPGSLWAALWPRKARLERSLAALDHTGQCSAVREVKLWRRIRPITTHDRNGCRRVHVPKK
jgi:hypothetical protein